MATGVTPTSAILSMHNSVVWGNQITGRKPPKKKHRLDAPSLSDAFDTSGTLIFIGSCVQDLTLGPQTPACISDDPIFVNPSGADGLTGTDDDDYRLAPGSPCIDAALDAILPMDTADIDGDKDLLEPLPLDLAGFTRIVDLSLTSMQTLDMGAYEAQQPSPGGPNLDADGDVDGFDLALLLGAWGRCGDCAKCSADLDDDCDVDGFDLALLLGAWG